jgi:hypothetical protein
LPEGSIWGFISAIIVLLFVGVSFWIYAMRLEVRVQVVKEGHAVRHMEKEFPEEESDFGPLDMTRPSTGNWGEV